MIQTKSTNDWQTIFVQKYPCKAILQDTAILAFQQLCISLNFHTEYDTEMINVHIQVVYITYITKKSLQMGIK